MTQNADEIFSVRRFLSSLNRADLKKEALLAESGIVVFEHIKANYCKTFPDVHSTDTQIKFKMAYNEETAHYTLQLRWHTVEQLSHPTLQLIFAIWEAISLKRCAA